MQTSNSMLQAVTSCIQSVSDAFRDPMLILDSSLFVVMANQAYYHAFGVIAPETEGRSIIDVGNGLWNVSELVIPLHAAVPSGQTISDLKIHVDSAMTGERVVCLSGRSLSLPGSESPSYLLSIVDITESEAHEVIRSDEQTRDKKIALALQRPMLFQPREDAFSGLTVHTAYAMASDEALVGGDFWDTFAFDHGHVALVIGDVMGHGLSSAVFINELRHTMRAYIREHEEPSQILFHMNQYLYQSNRLFQEGINTEGSDSPVCVAIAVIARETGAGTLAIAGMEPPILIRADGQTDQSAATGLPLGIEPNEEYSQIGFQLEAGDTLILTTDGITEARQGRAFLEAEGLMRLAISGNGGTLKGMADTILNGALNFAGGKLRDDAALVLVRRASHSPHIEEKDSAP